MFLLDTVVVSEIRRPRADRGVMAWFSSVSSSDLFLSTITICEIEIGIEKQRNDNRQFAAELDQWLDITLRTFADRILSLDVTTARRWGMLSARVGNKGLDLAIAATAIEHGLVIVTRNVDDFTPTGVKVINPFTPMPRKRR